MIICCPECRSTKIKKNGHIPNGKQNHYCKRCGRQFVENSNQKLISMEEKEQIRKLLLERIPLPGICRVMGVSLRWLLGFMVSEFLGSRGVCPEYEQLPDDLNYHASLETDKLLIRSIEEVDEMWSFVGSKENKQLECSKRMGNLTQSVCWNVRFVVSSSQKEPILLCQDVVSPEIRLSLSSII